ncbi:MAG TPA: 4Fe-4S dicluster domain-containing protein [Candidatus Krumholzibacteria bacterium]|nr:4Fe-4S dicluster domain-containing protein [Candidatus Krumholzibacteria bacterium]
MSTKALLVDISRCIGCGACVEACMQAHNQTGDYEQAKVLSANNYTVVQERGDYYVRRLCMHCLQPTCVSVCPVGALQKTADGPVVYEAAKCIGCRYCMQACPFSVPRYEWTKVVPRVAKCDMCATRKQGGTACAAACPEAATVFGSRDEMLAEARKRLKDDPAGYVQHIYGEEEAGGTSVLLISPVPLEQLGYPGNLPQDPLPARTWAALSHVPDVVTIGGAFLLAIWWITRRREEVARVEAAEAAALAVEPTTSGGEVFHGKHH